MKIQKSLLVAACFSALLTGCSATKEASIQGHSAFLGSDFQLLKKGTSEQAQLVYINPQTDFRRYDKVMITPVAIMRSKGSKLAEYSREDLKMIADKAAHSFATELSKRFKLVQSPQPGTLKVELAITDVDQSEPFLDTISSVIPQLRTLATLKGLVSDRPSFVGEASGEGKLSDAVTGDLLWAGIDRRVGTKNLSGVTNSWNDFDEAVDFWAKRFAYNLCLKQGGSGCVKP